MTKPTRAVESWPLWVLRTLALSLSAAVLAWPLALQSSVMVAALGAALGSLAARYIANSRLRSGVYPALALAAGTVVTFTYATLTGHVPFLQWLPNVLFSGWRVHQVLSLTEAVALGGAALTWVMLTRALAIRYAAWGVVEVAWVAVAASQLVVAHRFGSINRPFDLADPIIARGGDPTELLLWIGALATVVMALLLLGERGFWRTLLSLGVVAAVVLLLLATTKMLGLPTPPDAGGLGLRDKDKTKSDKGKQGKGQGQNQPKDSLEFKDDYNNNSQSVPIAVVLLHNDYSPPYGLYYFRQGAFSQFNGNRLIASTEVNTDMDLASYFPADHTVMGWSPAESIDRTQLETTVALLADHPKPFALEAPVALWPAPNPNPSRFRRMYKVSSLALTAEYRDLVGFDAGDADWSKAQWQHYTAAPDDPRYKELLERIFEKINPELRRDPMVRALAITSWLGEQGTYSLKSKHSGAADPTADFLFGDLIGYCVHFAHASVYLMRTAGLPARVATGYAVEESARRGGSTVLLSDRDAHAWPEVFIRDVGWVITDVSPQKVLDPPPDPPDPDLQRMLGEMARAESPVPPENGPPPTPITTLLRDAAKVLAMGLAMGLALLLMGLYIIKVWRRIAPWLAPQNQLSRVAYRRVLDQLSEVGLVRAVGESQEAFEKRLSRDFPSFSALTRYNLARVFGRDLGVDSKRVKQALVSVTHERRQVTKWYQRVLGTWLPWTWLRSR